MKQLRIGQIVYCKITGDGVIVIGFYQDWGKPVAEHVVYFETNEGKSYALTFKEFFETFDIDD